MSQDVSQAVIVDAEALRAEVRDKYRDVGPTLTVSSTSTPAGRPLAARLGYDPAVVDALPDRAVESFAGVANPFSLRRLQPGEWVVDVGSGPGSTRSSPPPRSVWRDA
jgi:hypothetical protein